MTSVLVVEDDQLIRDMVAKKLLGAGMSVSVTDTGENAIEMLRATHPEALVLDLMLPGKTGEEILAELKADPELKDTFVIVFSNKSTLEDETTVRKLGADRYMVKAETDLQELVKELQAH